MVSPLKGLGPPPLPPASQSQSPGAQSFSTIPSKPTYPPFQSYEALAETPCPTLQPQPSEDLVSSGPEDCGFFPNGAFDHCLSHIPSIYTDT
ncbi:GLIS family zinc finger 1 (predicted), isoform CRA_b [Rattus norvegicus]|uniref:GLIS family zinc finger 1 (Predicted), isoform CRA_b n=1 Tax=Rattus norvegicus TaxID=10116 RepID=A6JYS3_RAT|nr:GLIS family zinc finger 1 (predicted), isoform CRA_b [Rattus norvegicus]